MKIFLTGATGFLGQYVAKALKKQNHTVRVLIQKDSEKENFEKLGMEAVIGDLKNFPFSHLSGIEAVYHFAAIRYEWGFSWNEYKRINIEGTKRLLDASLENNIKRFIYCSTAFVHGYPKKLPITERFPYAPTSLYAKSKLEAEELVRKYSQEKGLFSIILRPSMVYGPGDTAGMFLKLCRLIKQKRFTIIGNGKNFVHLTYIDDLIQAFLQALYRGKTGGEYLVSSTKAIRLIELLHITSNQLNVPLLPIKIPFWLAKFAGFILEMIYKIGKSSRIRFFSAEPLITRSKVDIIAGSQFFDSSLARKELGFDPKISYNEGISRTINWYKSNEYL